MQNKKLGCLLLSLLVLLFSGCAATQSTHDYTAFKQSKPASILILPPVNQTTEVIGPYAMLSQMTMPLAESGYYVLPVAVVDETFKQNGMTVAADIQALPIDKLRNIFGADAALYVTLNQYGSSYRVIDSVTSVSADARLVDLRSGQTLWTGSATATNQSNNGGSNGLIGVLVAGIVNQIINSTTDASYPVAGQASWQLLSAGRPNGILYGPRSAKFNTD